MMKLNWNTKCKGKLLGAIFCFLLMLPTLDTNGQCGYGYKAYTVIGSAVSVELENSIGSASNALGAADRNTANFFQLDDSLQIKLEHTVNSGYNYSIVWKRQSGETATAEMAVYESIEGVTWFKQSTKPTSNSSSTFDSIVITAESSARYIRLVNRSSVGFEVDAISYNIDTCMVNNNPPNKIRGWIFEDADNNDAISTGDSPMQSVEVKLYNDVNDNDSLDASDVLLDSVESSSTGRYSFNVPSLSSTIIYQILSAADDVEEDMNSASGANVGTDLDFGYQLAGKPYMVGMRFSNVDLPQGATVLQAYVKFVASSNHSDSVSLRIYGENTGNSTALESGREVVSSLSRTDSIDWIDVEPWTVNNFYSSPDISPIINEIIGRSDWVAGNSITIMIQGGPNKREAFAFDAGSLTPPLLVVDTVGDLADHYVVSVQQRNAPSGYTVTTSSFGVDFDWCDQQDTVGNFALSPWVLPITLTDFRGACGDNGVNLDWEVASEIDNHFFDIQRSFSENGDFETIGTVPGAGTSFGEKGYSFLDQEIPAGEKVGYYRLKQVDFNGKFAVSAIIAVAIPESMGTLSGASIYPNPASDFIAVEVPGTFLNGRLDCFDLTGRLLFSVDCGSQQIISLSGYDLPSANYLLRLSGNGQSLEKMVAVK